jgi:hypothetical protein
MPIEKRKDESAEMLKSLVIIELAKAHVPQPRIRQIVGCGMGRVAEIARFFKQRTRHNDTTRG